MWGTGARFTKRLEDGKKQKVGKNGRKFTGGSRGSRGEGRTPTEERAFSLLSLLSLLPPIQFLHSNGNSGNLTRGSRKKDSKPQEFNRSSRNKTGRGI